MHQIAAELASLLLAAPEALRESLVLSLSQIAQDADTAAAVLALAVAMIHSPQ